jgi:hypothetical protein
MKENKSSNYEFPQEMQETFTPGRDCSIDELLLHYHNRSSHTLQISSKDAGRDYKAYTLNIFDYLYNFVFINRTEKIAEVRKISEKRQTSIMIK